MGVKVEMIGKKFGRLTCLRESAGHVVGQRLFYDFLCDCGTIKRIAGPRVRRGESRSCGCLKTELIHSKERSEQMQKVMRSKKLDLTGSRSGFLTYIRENCYQKGGYRCIDVQCVCGTIKMVKASDFVSERVISCGCARDASSQKKIAAYPNQKPNSQKVKRQK